jgi:hypothetical protein
MPERGEHGRHFIRRHEFEERQVLHSRTARSFDEGQDLLRHALAAHGAQGYWESQLQLSQRAQNPPEAYSSPFGLAIIYSHLGDKDKAFANLELAYGERDEEITNLAIEPQFDSLRSDPRFSDLIRRVGIPSR